MNIYEEELEDAEIGFTGLEGSTETEVFIVVRKMHYQELVFGYLTTRSSCSSTSP